MVLWVETGSHIAVLGGDLENDESYGWAAAIDETAKKRMGGRASLVKVPHHGSPDADEPRMWSELLEEEPEAVTTPYSTKRPQVEDVLRIATHTRKLRIAAGPRWTGRAAAVIRAAVPKASVDERREVGFVRYRAEPEGGWSVAEGLL